MCNATKTDRGPTIEAANLAGLPQGLAPGSLVVVDSERARLLLVLCVAWRSTTVTMWFVTPLVFF